MQYSLDRTPILDWQGPLGRTKPMHDLIQQYVADRNDLCNGSFCNLTDDGEDTTVTKIFNLIQEKTGEKLDKVVLLVWW